MEDRGTKITVGESTMSYALLQRDGQEYMKNNPVVVPKMMGIQATAAQRHSNWGLTFNGTEFPPPTDYKLDYEPIVSAERNANGDMMLEYIAEKRKLNLQWKQLSGKLYQKILQSRRGANITGNLFFFDPQENAVVEMMAYASPISAPLIRYEDERQIWENVAVNFIEM